ncbi:DUF502 domain-containing protein [Mangrovitalea sediminis]|uniref:DUF502 domain-containing protein n=1 Tax=Mangrovitalea sediminis TaxID=1982043 RepID=UPI000BE5686C|nr:DUF502 domain-containing protein [Mangrovitalea sediminis]
MQKIRNYLSGAFLAGLVMLLPIVILAMLFRWLFRLITQQIAPLTDILTQHTQIPALLSDILVVLIIALLVLMIGVLARTTMGTYLHGLFDRNMQRLFPGYQMVREIVQQLFGDRANSPFANGTVALVKLYGPSVELTATGIVTSRHDDGRFTVFVPTGPNPTTGFIYHVSADLVELRPDIKVEAALRTVIACGAGSARLLSPKPSSTDKEDSHDHAT